MAKSQTRNSLLLLGLLAGLGGAVYAWHRGTGATAQQVSGDYAIAAVPPGAPQMSILFIGNSYTYVNDLPLMLRAIAADAQNPIDIQTGEAVKGGALLAETWEDDAARALLASRHWNYVVLQEQSLMTMRPETEAVAKAGFLAWGQAANAAGSVPVVYETWARQPGSADYSGADAVAANLTTAPAMQAQIDFELNSFSSAIGAISVPAGDVWMRCAALPAAPLLYAPDGSHPSLAGTYLTALLFYRMLTGNAPASSQFIPAGLDPASAQILRGCAS